MLPSPYCSNNTIGKLNGNEEMENIQSKCDKVESVSIKDIKSVKDELTGLKASSADLKNCSKDISALKGDCDKNTKDLKNITTNTEGVREDLSSIRIDNSPVSINTIHNTIDVLNNDKGSAANSEDVSKVKADLTKVSTDIKERNKSLEDSLSEKMNAEIKDIDTKVKSFEKRIDGNSKGIDAIEVDKKIKPAKDDFNTSIDGKLKKILELEVVRLETLILKDKISSRITKAQFLETGQEQFDLLVSLRQDLLRLRQLQGYSDNDFDGALDLVEAWLEMGYDFQGDTDEHGDSREETIIGDPETNQPTMDTSHDDQLELNNAEEVDKTSSKSLTDIKDESNIQASIIKKSSENKIFDGLQKNSLIGSELSDTGDSDDGPKGNKKLDQKHLTRSSNITSAESWEECLALTEAPEMASFQKKKYAQDSTKKSSDDNLNLLKVEQGSNTTNATEAHNNTGITATSDTSGQENSKNSEPQNDSHEGIQKRRIGEQKTFMESEKLTPVPAGRVQRMSAYIPYDRGKTGEFAATIADTLDSRKDVRLDFEIGHSLRLAVSHQRDDVTGDIADECKTHNEHHEELGGPSDSISRTRKKSKEKHKKVDSFSDIENERENGCSHEKRVTKPYEEKHNFVPQDHNRNAMWECQDGGVMNHLPDIIHCHFCKKPREGNWICSKCDEINTPEKLVSYKKGYSKMREDNWRCTDRDYNNINWSRSLHCSRDGRYDAHLGAWNCKVRANLNSKDNNSCYSCKHTARWRVRKCESFHEGSLAKEAKLEKQRQAFINEMPGEVVGIPDTDVEPYGFLESIEENIMVQNANLVPIAPRKSKSREPPPESSFHDVLMVISKHGNPCVQAQILQKFNKAIDFLDPVKAVINKEQGKMLQELLKEENEFYGTQRMDMIVEVMHQNCSRSQDGQGSTQSKKVRNVDPSSNGKDILVNEEDEQVTNAPFPTYNEQEVPPMQTHASQILQSSTIDQRDLEEQLEKANDRNKSPNAANRALEETLQIKEEEKHEGETFVSEERQRPGLLEKEKLLKNKKFWLKTKNY